MARFYPDILTFSGLGLTHAGLHIIWHPGGAMVVTGGVLFLLGLLAARSEASEL
jgi:hypothetical protein